MRLFQLKCTKVRHYFLFISRIIRIIIIPKVKYCKGGLLIDKLKFSGILKQIKTTPNKINNTFIIEYILFFMD